MTTQHAHIFATDDTPADLLALGSALETEFDIQFATARAVLRFEVRDTGIGIAPGDQGRIFDLFEQIDDSSMRCHDGTGLGLALNRQLIELMGGEHGFHSQLGVGSVFWFTAHLRRLEATP
jgi:signal transduction histidine kinase